MTGFEEGSKNIVGKVTVLSILPHNVLSHYYVCDVISFSRFSLMGFSFYPVFNFFPPTELSFNLKSS